MGVVYIAGSAPGCGKTALASALALLLGLQGKRAALLKPFAQQPTGAATADQQFFQQVLPGNPSLQGWPMPFSSNTFSPGSGAARRLQEATASLASSYDPIILEGLDSLDPQTQLGSASAELAAVLEARVIAVARYARSLQPRDLAQTGELFGRRLAGVLVNAVPRYRGHETRTRLLLETQASPGVPVLGAVPEDRDMLAPSVGQVARHLNGEFLVGQEKAAELVHAFMVGGWFLDQGAYVFERRARKAVIARGDRPDLHMAALETSTACLVLTGGQHPVQYVLYEAEERGAPIILVSEGTLETMRKLESLLSWVSVHSPGKAQRFAELLKQHCNREALSAALGLGV